ncbi:MAG: hypothetical protein Q7P63_04535 [Verrucomicrobiota bacterium JB022]|nr:hypothetical protein [Verrucomicrobiota bacterium JB022]
MNPSVLSYRSTAGLLRRAAREPLSHERAGAMLGIAAEEAAFALEETGRHDPAVEAATLACSALARGELTPITLERLILRLADVIESLKQERRIQGFVPQNFYTKDELEGFFRPPEEVTPPSPSRPPVFRVLPPAP